MQLLSRADNYSTKQEVSSLPRPIEIELKQDTVREEGADDDKATIIEGNAQRRK